MTFDTDDLARESANAFARQLAAAIHKRFDTRVFGVYLLGSLAHGGFGRRYSDLDMALIVMGGLKDNELSDIRAAAAELSPVWAARLSVFWSDPNFVVGRFPPLDRIDYLDHAVTLVERQRSTPPRPTLDEIRTYLAGAPFAGWFASARQFAEKSELGSNEHKSYLRTLLYPARFIMSWRTCEPLFRPAWTSISSNGRWSAEGERKTPSGFGKIETFFPNISMCARGSRTRT